MPTQPDDLTFDHEKGILNIRVLVVVATPDGYLFEKSNDVYYYTIGGRVKIHETIAKAAQRELKEELDIKVENLELTGLIENFFEMNNREYHELNFVFQIQLESSLDLQRLEEVADTNGHVLIKKEELEKHDIRPRAISEVIHSSKPFCHVVNKDI